MLFMGEFNTDPSLVLGPLNSPLGEGSWKLAPGLSLTLPCTRFSFADFNLFFFFFLQTLAICMHASTFFF